MIEEFLQTLHDPSDHILVLDSGNNNRSAQTFKVMVVLILL